MSNSAYHLVAAGHRVADAWPLVERLLALAPSNRERLVDLRAIVDTHSLARFRSLRPRVQHELHVPPEHDAAFLAVFDPLCTEKYRRWDGQPGVLDGTGGRWLTLHDAEVDLLAALPPVPVELHGPSLTDDPFDRTLVPTEDDHPLCVCLEWPVRWPAVPAIDLGPHGKHAAVCLLVNGDDPYTPEIGEPGYRLYVVTEEPGDQRAAHLATAAGLRH